MKTINPAWRLTPIVACLGALGFLAGCDTEPDSHLVSAPPPTTTSTQQVTTTTSTAGPPAPVYVATVAPVPVVETVTTTQAPPMGQQEVAVASPGPGYVWLAGYWTWHDQQYQWMGGHWAMPPNGTTTWIAPRWEQESTGYRFYDGYWN